MNRHHGVYALLLQLTHSQPISVGRLGEHRFPPGWYLYFGSAHGSGGLSARTDRHRRFLGDRKKCHWHVDGLREHAKLHEIWYATVPPEAKHHWAQVAIELTDASCPVAGFGSSDCAAGCDAHLVKLPERPFASELRFLLKHLGHEADLRVRFEAPITVASLRRGESEMPIRSTYANGLRMLESLRDEHPVLVRSAIAGGSLSIAKREPAGLLLRSLASSEAEAKGLKQTVELALAVERIVANCGPDAVRVIFDPARPQGRKQVLELSRTSDIRQRYRIAEVMAARTHTIAIQGDDPVFDTVGFHEVPSRLGRAIGQYRAAVRADTVDAADLSMMHELLDRSVLELQRRLRSSGSPEVPAVLSRKGTSDTLQRLRSAGRGIGDLKSALKLTVKNLWDWEEMTRRGIRPTAEQYETVANQLGEFARVLSRS